MGCCCFLSENLPISLNDKTREQSLCVIIGLLFSIYNEQQFQMSLPLLISIHYTGTGHGLFGGDERVVYWKCEAGQVLKENLTIPLNNKAREKALLLASQQVRTSLELLH